MQAESSPMFYFKRFLPLFFLGFFISTGAAPIPQAQADSFSWPSLQRLLKRCVVIPAGEVEPGYFQTTNWASTCPKELKVTNSTAWFHLNGTDYQAFITDSLYSDGGDLNDVIVRTMQGAEVGRRENVLAYSDILLALAGGDENFPRVTVDPKLLDPALREDLESAILDQLDHLR
jgi:hypothetical protein